MYPPFDLLEYMWSSEEKQEELAPTNGEKVILEWTGLKDRNGQELYEGDLIVSPAKLVWRIEWSEGKSAWRYVRGGWSEQPYGKTGFGLTYLASTTMEKVGTIWENPDLLKDLP